MKSILLLSFSLALVMEFGCTNSKNTGGLEKFQTGQEKTDSQLVNSSDEYLDSIQKLGSEIGTLIASQELIKEQINYLTAQKDSLQSSLKQIDASLDQIRAKKIDPGIKGVNEKMDELKNLKELLTEQQGLQKKEILLATKKMEVFEEEKAVYLAQRQSLWDKGAPPSDFILVDSLLVGINTQINEQSNKVKILSRKVADIDDQVKTIDQQRNSLSINIRNNYTAQKIFEEFSTEEKERLEKQLVTTEEQLKLAMAEQEDLNAQISAHKGDEIYFQLKRDRIKNQELAEETILKQETLADQELEILKDKKSRRITYAILGIGIVAFVLFILYYVGKKRKSGKINN